MQRQDTILSVGELQGDSVSLNLSNKGYLTGKEDLREQGHSHSGREAVSAAMEGMLHDLAQVHLNVLLNTVEGWVRGRAHTSKRPGVALSLGIQSDVETKELAFDTDFIASPSLVIKLNKLKEIPTEVLLWHAKGTGAEARPLQHPLWKGHAIPRCS